MPVIKSARKKLKVDRKRESANKKIEALINLVIKKAQRKPTQESIREAFKAIDKGAKKNVFHKNKAARLKSRLSKLVGKKTQVKSDATKLKQTKRSDKNAKFL
jgi:small subunit ribosomal protein S20